MVYNKYVQYKEAAAEAEIAEAAQEEDNEVSTNSDTTLDLL